MPELISIIMPTFNHAAFIGDAIDSVRAQSYPNWELIIANNNSDEATNQIVRRYRDSRIRILPVANDGIIAVSRNIALGLAKGAYIAFMDSDDIWMPWKLEVQVNRLASDSRLKMCSTNADSFPGGQTNVLKMVRDRYVSFDTLLLKNVVICSSLLMARDPLDRGMYFDEARELRTVEDFDYWLRVLDDSQSKLLVLRDRSVRYRIHAMNESTQHGDFLRRRYERISAVLSKHRLRHPQSFASAQRAHNRTHLRQRAQQQYEVDHSFREILANPALSPAQKLFIPLARIVKYSYRNRE